MLPGSRYPHFGSPGTMLVIYIASASSLVALLPHLGFVDSSNFILYISEPSHRKAILHPLLCRCPISLNLHHTPITATRETTRRSATSLHSQLLQLVEMTSLDIYTLYVANSQRQTADNKTEQKTDLTHSLQRQLSHYCTPSPRDRPLHPLNPLAPTPFSCCTTLSSTRSLQQNSGALKRSDSPTRSGYVGAATA